MTGDKYPDDDDGEAEFLRAEDRRQRAAGRIRYCSQCFGSGYHKKGCPEDDDYDDEGEGR